MTKTQLKEIAKNIRIDIVKSLVAAGSGHLGGSLGLADVFTQLYFKTLRHRPNEPNWSERDRLILSIGHVAPVLYATLAHSGYFPLEELLTLRKLNSRLQGHPGKNHGLPGIEISSGSLGQGLSVAVGMALAAQIDKKEYRVFCVLGDGELQEGSCWEAAMSASHYQMNRLIAIIDRNYCQIDGNTESVMELEPLADKFKAFGWNVIQCNGNNFEELDIAFETATHSLSKPSVIIANTLMGKGVKNIEGNYQWHGKAPSTDEAADFIHQIQS
ncbi:MAG: transketolase [Bacteroidota bacterium]